MTIVVSSAFSIQIIAPGAGPYANYALGDCNRVYSGSVASQGANTEPPFGLLAFSGIAYDSVTGTIYVFGGGHGDSFSNSVWRTGVDTIGWTRDLAPDHSSYPSAPDTIAACYADTNWATYAAQLPTSCQWNVVPR